MYLHAPECVCLFTGLQLAHCWLLSGLPDWDCLILTQTLVKTRTANKKIPKLTCIKLYPPVRGVYYCSNVKRKPAMQGQLHPIWQPTLYYTEGQSLKIPPLPEKQPASSENCRFCFIIYLLTTEVYLQENIELRTRKKFC